MRTEAAFLFADIVGFSAYTEERGDEAAADLALSFCDEICQINRGHEAEDVKMIGDACLIYAPDAPAGVALGLDIVERIGPTHGFPRVRVGIDYGPAVERDGDWFGSTINIAARVVALAPAGAVVVTERARDAVGDATNTSFEDHGAPPLRGIRRPPRLFLARGSPCHLADHDSSQ